MKKNKRKLFILVIALLIFPITLSIIDQPIDLIKKAYRNFSGSKANLVVIANDSYPRPNYSWQNLAQGGEQQGNTFDQITDEVRALEPEYIRIDHIYDYYDVVERSNSGLSFNWSKLDHEVEQIVSTGAKPFFSLSYMPMILSRSNEVDVPLDWAEWRLLVQKTIEHYSGRNEMAQNLVYYEVWNEPDLFGEFKLYGDKNYLELYRNAALGAQDAQNVLDFRIGGPATTHLMRNWFVNFLDFTSQNDLRVDFYSWHVYSKDLEQYEKDRLRVGEWLLEYPHYSNIEMIISENGYNSDMDRAHDNNLSAIHTLAVAAEVDNKIDRVFNFEIKDGLNNKKYWGRWGILTHEDHGEPIEKPRYFAFQFLNQLAGDRYVVLGNGTWVKSIASKIGDNIRVLIVNYDPFGIHSENVPINFVNLPFREFTYTRFDFLGESLSDQVSLLEDNWTVNEFLEPNTAAILELKPI